MTAQRTPTRRAETRMRLRSWVAGSAQPMRPYMGWHKPEERKP